MQRKKNKNTFKSSVSPQVALMYEALGFTLLRKQDLCCLENGEAHSRAF